MAAELFKLDGPKRPSEFGRIIPPDNEWIATQPFEAILFPALEIIDAHHHLWDHPGFRYLVPEFAADMEGHNVVATIFAECHSMYRAEGPPQLRHVGETEFVIGQQAYAASGQYGHAHIAAGIIGHADLRLGAGVEEALNAHIAVAHDRFKGIRYSANYDPSDAIMGSPSDDRPGVLADPKIREGLKTLAQMGLSFDCWVFFHQLDEVVALARAIPELNIILNHCGGPLGYGPYASNRDEHYRLWSEGMQRVALEPNVSCKVGGIMGRGAAYDYIHAETPPDSQTLADLWRPWFEPTIEWFGADRCMFESNYPLEKMGTSYRTLYNCFKRIASNASVSEREALFAGTARNIYRM
ncbi:amidohydrolase family protein [Sphingobium sp. SCG-1]|uniref:amidohydrolase family protein n=1 Tax=Sphingobium sp. SCG-1 TaxID=2072936 RepID=UPI001CB8CACB|nr:amidohydrolase family protein [Sphingobium sp. SCG-1]